MRGVRMDIMDPSLRSASDNSLFIAPCTQSIQIQNFEVHMYCD